jgi:pimeloyl-ACP methyl ester carboxylesterase
MSTAITAKEDHQMPTLQVNHVRLAYQASGAGSPVVLVHGSWGDHEVWGQLAPLLARHRTVISYDRRGHSASDRPAGPRRIRDDDVEDLAGLIASVADGPADLVGNSLGASIALRLAARHPGLVRSVSAHEPPLFPLLEEASPAARADRDAMAASIASTLDLIGQGQHADGTRLFMETVAFGPGAWDQLPGPMRDTFVFNAPAFQGEATAPDCFSLELADLAATATPVQLTYGGDTRPAFREITEILARRLPGAGRQSIDGAGHVPQLTHPRQLAELIEDFWATAGKEAVRPA